VNAIESLMEKRGAFDYILLETTGLADPGNIAPLFWVDEGLGSSIYLDGIVTMVDAKNILRSLDEPLPDTVQHIDDHAHSGPELTTAHLQISHADIILLNKSDLVSPEQLEIVQERIRGINSLAKIQITSHSRVPALEGVLLDIHAYDSVKTEDLTFSTKGHSHLDPTISTIALDIPRLNSDGLSRLEKWLQSVLWESKLPGFDQAIIDTHRVKGRICLADSKVKLIQGVREIFEIIDTNDSDSSNGKLVIIGRGIGRDEFSTSLISSLNLGN
jgi:G3E family GTPase